MTTAQAYAMGVQDGLDAWLAGEPLSMGMAWPDDPDLNEAYDAGVNVFCPEDPDNV